MTAFDIHVYLQEKKQLIDRTLDSLLPADEAHPAHLHRAMRYCLFAGGKRLRPILALAAAEAVGGDPAAMLRQASALELIHTYTLLHDDLPSMDNDDVRRGCPATHTVFGEAVAILAGDALQAEAFRMLAEGVEARHDPARVLAAIACIARACGSQGVVGGQVVDIESEGREIDGETLEYIHRHKTGSLIRASVMLGAIICGATPRQLRLLEDYGDAIGLAFQITDDVLDVLGTTQTLGKTAGSDLAHRKATYPSVLGLERARTLQQSLYRQAIEALDAFDDKALPLREIARLVIERNK